MADDDLHLNYDVSAELFKAQNEFSWTTQQLPEDDMATARKEALARIDAIFTSGDSVEMARSIVGNPQSPIAAEIEALIDKMKAKHGDVPETQKEANERKEEAAKEISGALLGGAAALGAAGVAASQSQDQGGGFLSSLFGANDKYLAGPSALLPASAAHDIATVEHIGGALAQHVQDIIPLDESPSAQQPSHGIPGKIQNQQQGVGV